MPYLPSAGNGVEKLEAYQLERHLSKLQHTVSVITVRATVIILHQLCEAWVENHLFTSVLSFVLKGERSVGTAHQPEMLSAE